MGYFSNGSEHDYYHEKFCGRCKNYRDSGDGSGEGCPIMDLHWLWNYDAVGKDADKTKATALNLFIPIEGTENKQCTMFIARRKAT